MGEICLGLGASHSPVLFVDPEKWLARVHEGGSTVGEPESFKLTPENVEKTKAQIRRCHEAYRELHKLLTDARPDALVIIGDDQGENFTSGIMPPLAIYIGSDAEGSFSLGRRLPLEEQEDLRRVKVTCDDALARQILQEFMNNDLDVAFSDKLPGKGLGHAHIWPLKFLLPELEIPIVPIFINAYFPPQPKPIRCYLLGALLAKAVQKSGKRVAIFGSGGLSHFPRHLGPWGISPYPIEKRWYIDEAFDREVLSLMISGRGRDLADLTSEDLQRSGNLELRNWIALSGALGERKGRLLAYEPVYTVAIGLAFSAWT
jgi:aromatic ring-opening dioxygenase LigB subunit